MAEVWQAIYRVADGELVSVGTVVSARLEEGLASIPLAREPNWAIERWNPTQLLLEPRPSEPAPVDRIAALEADPEIQALAPDVRALLHDKLLASFGDVRTG